MPSRFDPLRDLDRLAQSVGRTLGQLVDRPGAVRSRRGEGGTDLEIDLPGVKAADIELDVQADRVVVRAVRRAAAGGGRDDDSRVEQTWELDDAVDVDRVSADYEDGVLTVHLPRPTEAPARRVPVRSAGATPPPAEPAPSEPARAGPTDAGAGTVPPTAPPPPGEQANPLPTS